MENLDEKKQIWWRKEGCFLFQKDNAKIKTYETKSQLNLKHFKIQF